MVLNAAREDAPSQDGGPRMTRGDAIAHILGLSMAVVGELCCGGRSEEEALEQDTRDALEALGVTDSELEAWARGE